MKKLLLVMSLAMVSMVFSSCYKKQYEEALKVNDSMSSVVEAKDVELDSMFATLNQIEENLANINARYNTVQQLRRGNAEGQAGIKGQINEQISSIESMMAANKQKIASLQSRLSKSNKETARLQELVNRQEERIAAQEAQIAELLTELENNKVLIKKLNQDVSELTASNKEKDQFIQQQTSEANRAYYVVGVYADLRDKGIVAKYGGLIGIGRTLATNPDMLMEQFTEIDRTKVTTIPVNLRKARVVSKHAANSYELVMDENDSRMVSYLRILNPTKFWEQTRYLVISTR